jgi:hypothetical protein
MPDTYDAALAQRLGADDHGMAIYVMAFLKAGPIRNQSEAEAEACSERISTISIVLGLGKTAGCRPFSG